MYTLGDFKLGQTVRGVFLDDEPTTVFGDTNDCYGDAEPFTGQVLTIDVESYGGPYIIVDDGESLYNCDIEEITEIPE
jgi:hypothetical protein